MNFKKSVLRASGFCPTWWAALALSTMAACGPSRPPAASWALDPAAFSGERALEACAAFVQLGPKVAGTEDARRAAEYIVARMHALGYAWSVNEFRETTPDGLLTFRNVMARHSPTGAVRRIIVLGAHYDTKSGIDGFVGANDSGSGVAVLLEVARVLSKSPAPPPGVEIRFAFFDGEECRQSYGPHDGLHGSRHLADQAMREGWAPQIAGVVIVDMVGDRDLNISLPANVTPSMAQRIFLAAKEENVRNQISWSHNAVLDDHVPFLDAGIPALNLMDFEYGSAPGLNDFWHTPEDRMDHISAKSLETAGKITMRLIRHLSEDR